MPFSKLKKGPEFPKKLFVSKLDDIEILLWNMGMKIKFAFHKKIELFSKFLTLFSKLGIALSNHIAGLKHHTTIGKFWQVWWHLVGWGWKGQQKSHAMWHTFWDPHAVYIPDVIGNVGLMDGKLHVHKKSQSYKRKSKIYKTIWFSYEMQIWFACLCFIIKFQFRLVPRQKIFWPSLQFHGRNAKISEKIFVSKLNGIEILLWNMGITIKFAFHKKIELFSKILTLFSKLGMVLSKCIAGLTHHVTIGNSWQAWRPRLEGDGEGDKKARQCDINFWNPHAVYIPYVIGKIRLVAQQIPPLLNKVKNLQNNSIFLWNANVIFMPIL